MTTQPSDAALAAAFREAAACFQPSYLPFARLDVQSVLNRARELDAAKGGLTDGELSRQMQNAVARHDALPDYLKATPPTQTGDAVERVARALFGLAQNADQWLDFHDTVRDEFRRMARAAIAAMLASGEGVDAARYRWLRDEAWKVDRMSPAVILATSDFSVESEHTGGIVFHDELDAAIDAARGE